MCPVKCLARRVIHLRAHNAAPNTPLATAFLPTGDTIGLKPADITATLRLAVRFLGPSALGFLPSDISAVPYEPQVPMHYYVEGLIRMLSVSLVDGAPTKCSNTFTPPPSPSCVTSPSRCSLEEPSRSSPIKLAPPSNTHPPTLWSWRTASHQTQAFYACGR